MKKFLAVVVLAVSALAASCANQASFSDSGRNNSHPAVVKADHSSPSHEAKSEHSFR
jgi:opacity protein-like surface antigen